MKIKEGDKMKKIGVVGQGYVGTAVSTVFDKHYDVETYDINGKCSCPA